MSEKTFLQSEEWLKFQEKAGRKTHRIESDGFCAGIIEHELPIVGKYFYVPRGLQIATSKMQKIIELAKKENAGWIRIDPADENILELIKNGIGYKISKAPHDMQPRENFVIDIAKSEEELLAGMKPKTRYNIKIAQKNVVIRIADKFESTNADEEFLRLTKEMAMRQGIKTHPEEYYKKMIESLPEEMLKLYIAEYDGKIIAANLVLFCGETATYLHGASGNESRNLMAPYLLQWQAILDAKEKGCKYYDFGGVKTHNVERGAHNDWAGITKFKLGFSPSTTPVVFPGSYDIIVNPARYAVYRTFQHIKALIYRFRK